MTFALHPSVPATRHSIAWRPIVSALLVAAVVLLLMWTARSTSGGNAQPEQIAPGPPSSVEVLSAMNA